MQDRNVNGFSADEIDDALRGAVTGSAKLIPRFEVLDQDNQVIRETTNIQSGSVRNRSGDQIKRTLECVVREANITLADYPDLVISHGPLVYYRFGETSGTNANDETANNLDGTYTNTPTLNTASLLLGDTANGSVTLNGSNEYVTRAHTAAFNAANITVEAWIKTTASGATQVIAARDDAGSNKSWQLRLTSAGFLELVLWFSAASTSYTSAAPINDGLPHHVLATYNGAHVMLYVDSYRVKKTAETRTLDTASVALTVGANGAPGAYFNGSIDEFAYYGRALSSAEDREHYQKGSNNLEEIDFTRDRLGIVVKIRMNRNGDDGTPWAEFALGKFLLSAPDRDMNDKGISRQVQGFDQTTVLFQAAVTARYVIVSGTNYITAVTTLLTSVGLDVTGYQLTPTSLTLPSTRTWPLGTTKLQIINDLLEAINYRKFRFDSNGLGIAEPDVLPKNRAIDYAYTTDEFSVMSPNMRYSQDLFGAYNVVVLSNTQPKQNTITATARNNLLASPISVARRSGGVSGAGEVVYADNNFDAADQATITAAANNLLTRFSLPAETWRFGTLAHPFHEDEDVLTLTDNTGLYSFGLSANYLEVEWTLPFTDLAVGTMEHVAQRILAVA